MWKCTYCYLLLFCLSFVELSAQQDSILLTKNFKFEDGIYFQLEDLQKNQPTLAWKDVFASLYTNPQTFVTKVDFIQSGEKDLELDSIFSLVLGGIPYIQVNDLLGNSSLKNFVGLQVRGNISYLSYPQKIQKEIPMEAYNPLTGKAFRKATIQREVTIQKEKIFHFETGVIANFTKENLLQWIASDKGLSKSVQELQPSEIEEKLFKCLLIFDDRNPYYLK